MKDWIASVRSRPAYRKVAVAGLILVVVYTLFGFFGLPAILKSVLPDTLSRTLHRKTEIRDIRFNPFELSVSVRGIRIAERDGGKTWISAEEIFANAQLASIIRGGPVLGEVRIVKPYANIVRRPDGSYNFTDLIDEFTKDTGKKSKPLKYSFNNIQLIDGRIDFDDGPKKTRHEVRGIHLAVPFVSNLPYYVDRYIQPSFAAVVNGNAVSLKGRTKPFSDSRETVFDVNIADLNIPYYLEYVPIQREYKVPSAFLDLSAVVSFAQPKGKPPTVRVEGDATLREIRVRGKDDRPMIHLPSTKASLLPSDVMAREFRLASIVVRDPEIDVTLDPGGKLNLLSLVPEKAKGEDGGERAGKSVPDAAPAVETRFSVESIRLSGGKVRFSDASRQAPFRTALGEIRLDVDRLSTEKGKKAEALLAFKTDAGETFELKGSLSLNPLFSEGTAALGKVVLNRYAPYYAGAVRFDILGGTLDVRSGYRFAPAEGGTGIRLSGLEARLSDLRLRQREEKEEFLKIPETTVREAAIDLDRREVEVGEAATRKGSVSVRRGPGGETNVARLVPEGQAVPASASSVPATGKTPEKGAGKAWTVTLRKASIDRYAVRFEDKTTTPPVAIALDRIQARVENVTTVRNRKGKASVSTVVERDGNISLAGAFSIEPPSVAVKVRVKALPVVPVQPYFTDAVKILVTGGSVSAEGNLSVDAAKGTPVKVVYKGEASVNGFSSVDKALGEEFLKFASLHFAGVEAGYNPTKVSIGEVALSDFYSRIVVNPDATLNLQGILGKGKAGPEGGSKPPEAAPADNAVKSPPTPVRIETVTLQGGTISFSDRYVKPNYSANLVEIGGRVSGLSSEEGVAGDVSLRGKLENSAPLEIAGKINPLARDLFVDLKVDFKDIDLSSLSPYAGRYAGYGIRKGKLSLGLQYRIDKKRLDADNKVFLDQFTFGDPVESPTATKLPVRLAVALLKDRQGEIHLDLPVTGRTDDPKFSVWGIVVKIIVNILVKAATSPFALLGAIFGGGEDISYLEFDAGRAALTGAAEGKLANMEKALAERPGLQLEVEGHVDLEKDPEALRTIAFQRKVAAAKLKDLVRSGQSVPSLDNVVVGKDEYPVYLKRAYREEKFPKPRNFIGMAKDLPVPEMEKLMLTHIRITDDDLRELARRRSTGVIDRIIRSGKVDPGRVFLVEPKSLPPERKEKTKDSRVDFRIK